MILTLLTGTTRRLNILIFARTCSYRVEFILPSQSAQSEFSQYAHMDKLFTIIFLVLFDSINYAGYDKL